MSALGSMSSARVQAAGTSIGRTAAPPLTCKPATAPCSAASRFGCGTSSSRAAAPARPLARKCAAVQSTAGLPQAPTTVPNGKHISSTEVPPFIPRDDLVDQLFRWSMMEAGEGGQRSFGLPMKVEPTYHDDKLWGFNVSIFKEGAKLTDVAVFMDKLSLSKHEWVGRGQDGFPVLEGRVEMVLGKNLEIW